MAASSLYEWIEESINRIVSGETFTREDFDAQPRNGWEEIKPKPGIVKCSKRDPAFFAWLALRWWTQDDDIRAKDPEYGEMRKRELEGLLDRCEIAKDPSIRSAKLPNARRLRHSTLHV